MSSSPPKVLLAMSGGVDSSVAAVLLKEQGYDVVGCFMRLGSPGESLDGLVPADDAACNLKIGKQGCCSVGDAMDARTVATRLDIPFYVCNFKRDFGRIIDYFTAEYNAGRTPNPCVRCNDWLKFGKLHEYAKQIGADFVASGHYARIDRTDPTVPRLLRGTDLDKDQSYVLFGAPRDRLQSMMLPIGGYQKCEIREIARDHDLPVFDKPDSQEICFVPDNDYAGLVTRRSPDQVRPGVIRDESGDAIGEHPGHQHFTVGQRRKIGVALGYPLYVVEKHASTNEIIVGERSSLARDGCIASDVNWFIDPPATWRSCTAKIRYNADPVAARVRGDAASIEVRFDESQDAVAPGQAVVCYEDDVVIGGGWIQDALPLVARDEARAASTSR